MTAEIAKAFKTLDRHELDVDYTNVRRMLSFDADWDVDECEFVASEFDDLMDDATCPSEVVDAIYTIVENIWP